MVFPRVLLPFLLAANLGATATDAEHANLLAAFATLSASSAWPVQGGLRDHIDETFGPRLQPSTNLYDWHRGLDFDSNSGSNKTIVAACDGKFYRYSYLSNSSGYTLVLEHQLPSTVYYNGRNLTKFFTYYLHLDDSAKPQWLVDAIADEAADPKIYKTVTAGTAVATMGNSGASGGENYDVHLHFEVRVGSVSSLEFQLANPNTTQWGFDPHMHPLLLYPATSQAIAVTQLARPTSVGDGRFRITTDNDDRPVLNRFEVRALDTNNGNSTIKSHILDLNRRIGFDATSTANLDTRDTSKPYLDPVEFTEDQTDYATELVIPASFLSDVFQPGISLQVKALDLWNGEGSASTPPPTPLEAWRAQHFGTLENSGIAANNSNPSGNGVSNLIAYACNLDPSDPILLQLDPEAGTQGLPAVGVDQAGQPRLKLEFLRRTASSSPGIAYAVESGPPGGPWITPAGTENVTAISPLWERVVWVSHEPLAPGEARLVRLRVSEL